MAGFVYRNAKGLYTFLLCLEQGPRGVLDPVAVVTPFRSIIAVLRKPVAYDDEHFHGVTCCHELLAAVAYGGSHAGRAARPHGGDVVQGLV